MAKSKPQKTPVIRLRHTHFEGDSMFYFYEGETAIRGGVIEVPADRPEWAQRAWIKGYRLNVESGEHRTIEDILAECDYKTAKSAESAEEKTNAGSDTGRQSTADDGVRTGEPDGAGSVPEPVVGSGGSDGPAVQEVGEAAAV